MCHRCGYESDSDALSLLLAISMNKKIVDDGKGETNITDLEVDAMNAEGLANINDEDHMNNFTGIVNGMDDDYIDNMMDIASPDHDDHDNDDDQPLNVVSVAPWVSMQKNAGFYTRTTGGLHTYAAVSIVQAGHESYEEIPVETSSRLLQK